MEEQNQNTTSQCGMSKLQKIIGGKWKLVILWALHDQTKRFGELSREFSFITQSMLTKQLRELEDDGLVTRYVYREVPPRVEYSLTELGQKFIPLLIELDSWGKGNLPQYSEPLSEQ